MVRGAVKSHRVGRATLDTGVVTTTDGADIYAGYVAVSPGYNDWRGYVGRGFTPLGVGSLTEMQATVAQRAREILTHGEDLHHAS